MIEEPSTNVIIGHDTNGRFAAGNTLGRGNPHAAQVSRLRSAMLSAVTEDDMKAVVAKLVELAKGGDVPAVGLLLNRLLGKVVAEVGWAASGDAGGGQAERQNSEGEAWPTQRLGRFRSRVRPASL